MKPEILERETVYTGYMTVERLRVRLTDGAEVIRDMERHGDAVAVLPYDPQTRTALIVRLFRLPAFDRFGELSVDEACAGMVESDDVEQDVRREALEELGLRLGPLEAVGRVWSSPGVSAERVSLFVAAFSPGDRIAPGGGVQEEHEGISVIKRPLADLATDADTGGIVDIKLLTLVLALRARKPELFVLGGGEAR
jgi:nudix-type nucleoside diphosphatase (YffH/AdpP family)